MKAIITGATGGLGRSYVKECASKGYNLVLSATNQARLDALKEEIQQTYKNITIETKACKLNEKQSREEFYNTRARLLKDMDKAVRDTVQTDEVFNIWFSYVCMCLFIWLLYSFYLCFWNVIS